LEQQLASTEVSLQTSTQTKQDLFNKFGGVLFGYISEVVKNKPLAEKYLVDIFNQLQFSDIQDITRPGINTFIYLQTIARNKLAAFTASVNEYADTRKPSTITVKDNKFIDLMNPDQQQVFCGIHYHGKTAAQIAAELNKTEDAVRELLRESFHIIRSNRQ
jgi:DNA-directed RNA polymerase specialized sigma24 family protein